MLLLLTRLLVLVLLFLFHVHVVVLLFLFFLIVVPAAALRIVALVVFGVAEHEFIHKSVLYRLAQIFLNEHMQVPLKKVTTHVAFVVNFLKGQLREEFDKRKWVEVVSGITDVLEVAVLPVKLPRESRVPITAQQI